MENQECLDEHQIWESDNHIFQIEKLGKSYRAVMFRKNGEDLIYVECAFYQDIGKLKKLITKLKLEPTNKSLSLRSMK